MARLANTIEAILYLKARPLTLAQLAEFSGCDRDATEEGLIELMGDYAHRDSALEIAETENGYCLQLKPPFKPLVEELIPLEIGLGALRTLAAIALSGTISQTDLVELRGSGAYQHVPELIDQGMVRKRRQSDGRSFWLHVTEKFYQRFEIDKLPKITVPKKRRTADEEGDPETVTAENAPENGTADSAEIDGASAETADTLPETTAEGQAESVPPEVSVSLVADENTPSPPPSTGENPVEEVVTEAITDEASTASDNPDEVDRASEATFEETSPASIEADDLAAAPSTAEADVETLTDGPETKNGAAHNEAALAPDEQLASLSQTMEPSPENADPIMAEPPHTDAPQDKESLPILETAIEGANSP